MKKTVFVYTKSVYPGEAYTEKFLLDFHQGYMNAGWDSVLIQDKKWAVPDKNPHLAVFFGSWNAKKLKRHHHRLKCQLVNYYNKNKIPFIVIESPLFGRMNNPIKSLDYWRVGINHYMLDMGKFWQGQCPSDRWEMMSQKPELGLNLKPWRTKGRKILICKQNESDASLRGSNHKEWVKTTYKEIKKITDRDVEVRFHPTEAEKVKNALIEEFQQSRIPISNIEPKSFVEDLEDAFCTVTYSSSSSIDSIINGVPSIAMHPGNMSYPICNHKIKFVNGPILFEREPHLYNLSYAQWNMKTELTNGKCIEHLERCLYPTISNK